MIHPALKRNMSSLIGQSAILYAQSSVADKGQRECSSKSRGFEQLLSDRWEWEHLHLHTLQTLSGKRLCIYIILLLLQEKAFVNATPGKRDLKQLDRSILRKYAIYKSYEFHFKMITAQCA